MEQLLVHLFADYWLQNDWMALNKKEHWLPAIVHGLIYTLPFLILTRSPWALLIICITHIIIDHTNIVGKLNQIKNWDFKEDNYAFLDSQVPLGEIMAPIKDGYFGRPFAIRVWLIIIQDNILHLIINYLCLRYL
jgi:hypothetical protein